MGLSLRKKSVVEMTVLRSRCWKSKYIRDIAICEQHMADQRLIDRE